MPGGDRTGPLGAGPATGWGRGPCGGGMAWGRGGGRGRGGGYGWGRGGGYGPGFGRWYGWGPLPVELDPAVERDRLQDEVVWLRRQADALEARLAMADAPGETGSTE